MANAVTRRYWKAFVYGCGGCDASVEFYLEEGLEGPGAQEVPVPAELIAAYETAGGAVDVETVPATESGRIILPVPFVAAGCPRCQGEPPWDPGGACLTHVDWNRDRDLDPPVEGWEGCRFDYPDDPNAHHACGRPVVVPELLTGP